MQHEEKPNIVGRAVLAITLMALFFALGIAAIIGLVYAGVALFELVGHIRGKGVIMIVLGGVACFAAAAVLLWSILPRWDRFEAPGPELDPEKEPELFAEIRAIAQATGQEMPKHVYAVLDMNAFVMERGGIMGFGSRRVMGLGIPLMQMLTVAELRAVIAHEFGHFHGGDTKVGPWIYKTRGALGRSVANLTGLAKVANHADGLFALMMLGIRKPFIWFFQGFMRVSQAVSRSQEVAADALACRVVGSAPLATGLKKVAGGSYGFDLYLRDDVGPFVDKGYRPPIVDGFARFLTARAGQDVMNKAAEHSLTEEVDPYDSHPPLAQRVAAADRLAAPTQKIDDRPGIALLRDVRALEELTLNEKVRALPAADWEKAIEILVESWKQTREKYAKALRNVSIDAPPMDTRAIRELMRGTALEDVMWDIEDHVVLSWGRGLLSSGLNLALIESGYVPTTGPGEPIWFKRDGGEPFDLQPKLSELFEGKLDHAGWSAWTASLGLSGRSLAGQAAG